MPDTTFKSGYITGWQSIWGAEIVPVVPLFHVPAGQTPYLAGVA